MRIRSTRHTSRRSLLRGAFAGSLVSVGLPFLDCMLNESGTALAAGGQLPVRFGTWFWGLGHTPGHGVEEKAATSPGINFLGEPKALNRHKDVINFLGKFNMPLDGRSNYPHESGWIASRTGTAPDKDKEIPATTFDLLIADKIGNNTRLKTIDVTCTNNPNDSYSARGTYTRTAAEISPTSLYTRLFGPDFVDPNKADFTPDPRVLVRQSVLSAVKEERQQFMKHIGAADRAQLDEYFTSIREIENQLEVQLQKPAPNEACHVIPAPEVSDLVGGIAGVEIEQVQSTHETFARMLAMAVACNQSHVFNVTFSNSGSSLRKAGESLTHHSLSHEERVDPELGLQPQTSWFNTRSMDSLATFIDVFSSIREGDGTLLDNVLIIAGSETGDARTHSIDEVPFMTIGRAGGRIKTGLYVNGNASPTTRVGLTAMQIMGVSNDSWGTRSLETSKVISDILV